MDVAGLAARLNELGVNAQTYRVGPYGSGASEAIHLERTDGGYEVSYSERGGKSLMATFETEADACEYVLSQLTRDELASLHIFATFDSQAQAGALASKLTVAGVRVRTDSIPSGKSRVFVHGSDLQKARKVRGW